MDHYILSQLVNICMVYIYFVFYIPEGSNFMLLSFWISSTIHLKAFQSFCCFRDDNMITFFNHFPWNWFYFFTIVCIIFLGIMLINLVYNNIKTKKIIKYKKNQITHSVSNNNVNLFLAVPTMFDYPLHIRHQFVE